MVRTPNTLTALLGLSGAAYGIAFWAMVTLDAGSAWSRFSALSESGAHGRAVGHGDQAIALWVEDDRDTDKLNEMKLAVADSHHAEGDPLRAIQLYREVLASPLGAAMTLPQQMEIKHRIATMSLATGSPVDAAVLISEFVDAAGDAAARAHPEDPDEDGHGDAVQYLQYAEEAIAGFTDALPPMLDREIITGDEPARLAAAERLTNLGGYYAGAKDGDYAAAGLLSAAYTTRVNILGPNGEDTVQTALLLAPVYERIGRLSDAEDLYLSTFHAMERAKGSNNPELSLYIRLLADIYRRQGRVTEAEALNVHMRTMFRDAFGARRYAANRDRDRVADINRPVSPDFPLPADYAPDDLVLASAYSIPTSKNPGIDEMRIRAAQLDEETTMPGMLAGLIKECSIPEEKLSLRSGYRSYATQASLYSRSENGQVAKPGTSEHQTGLAVDIDVNGRFMRSTDRAYQCFEAQAWRYGFILSFPRDNAYLDAADTYEPWHWRFVGTQTALLYREMGPLGYPQEFLAALPCYEERALSGLFLGAGEKDVCLASVIGDKTAAAPVGNDNNRDG